MDVLYFQITIEKQDILALEERDTLPWDLHSWDI